MRKAGLAVAAGVGIGLAIVLRQQRREARRAVFSKVFGPQLTAMIHDRRVQRVARQLSEHKSGRPISLRKKAVAHQVPKAGDLDLSGLDIDPELVNEATTIKLDEWKQELESQREWFQSPTVDEAEAILLGAGWKDQQDAGVTTWA